MTVIDMIYINVCLKKRDTRENDPVSISQYGCHYHHYGTYP